MGKKRWLALLLLLGLTAGCGAKGTNGTDSVHTPSDAPQPAIQGSQPAAQGGSPQVSTSGTQESTADAGPRWFKTSASADAKGNITAQPGPVVDQITQILKAKGAKFTEGDPRVFFLPTLKNPPAGFAQLIGVTTGWSFYLFGADQAASQVGLIGSADQVINNPSTVYYTVEGNRILLWSEASRSMTTALDWDGSKLQNIPLAQVDPTAALFDRRARLLWGGSLEEYMQIQLPADVHYTNYPPYYEQAGSAVVRLYVAATDQFHPATQADALRFMDYGVKEYVKAFGGLFPDEPNFRSEYAAFKATNSMMADVATDYGSLLVQAARNAEAETVLLDVIRHSPNKTQAYLALGDAAWNLGKTDTAKQYYQKYLSLLGSDQSQVPDRVKQRLK